MTEDILIPTVNRESKSRQYLKRVRAKDTRHFGNEPQWNASNAKTKEEIKKELIKVFNWYSYSFGSKEAKQWILEYLKTKNNIKKDTIDAISNATEYSNTAGWIARLIVQGAKNFPEYCLEYLEKNIKSMKNQGMALVFKQKENIINLQKGRNEYQKRQEEKGKALIYKHLSEIDYKVDEFITNKFNIDFNIKKYLKENGVTKDQAKEMSSYLVQHYALEFKDVYDKKDEDLVEAYSCYSRSQIKKILDFINVMIGDCIDWEAVAPNKIKSQRKPRKKKIKPASLQVKKLYFQKDSKEFKLTSVSPEKIIGATQLWIFNTKYRVLGCYNACDSSGFFVKGSTVKNFDQMTSIEKKLRKPNEILKGILEGGKISIRKTFSKLKTKEKKLTGRINNQTILLRVL